MRRDTLYLPWVARCFIPLACLVSVVVFAGSVTELRQFKLGRGKSLELQVPKDWKQKVRKSKGSIAISIDFSMEKSQAMELHVTGMVGPWVSKLSSDPSALQQFVQSQMKRMEPTAEPGSMKLFRFQADSGSGYMYTAADKNPDVGGYKYLRQGAITLADDFVASFSVLSNDSEAPEVQDALQVLKTARYVAK